MNKVLVLISIVLLISCGTTQQHEKGDTKANYIPDSVELDVRHMITRNMYVSGCREKTWDASVEI